MKTSKSTRLGSALGLALFPVVASATIYNPATDFSQAANPSVSGVWTYGWSATLGGAFNAFQIDTTVFAGPGYVQWRGDQPPGADGNPSVFENVSGGPLTIGTISMPTGALAMHPGSAGQYSVIEFTAPTAGQYSIAGAFSGLDFAGPTSTDVHVLVNGSSIFSGVVDGFGAGSATPFGSTVTLAAGGIIDFVVGFDGGAGQDAGGPNFYYDSTGLSATISAVPEPSTIFAGALMLLPLGVGALRIVRKNRPA